jgi:hypothetical protein
MEFFAHSHAFEVAFQLKVGLQLQALWLVVAVPGLFSKPSQLSHTDPPLSYSATPVHVNLRMGLPSARILISSDELWVVRVLR